MPYESKADVILQKDRKPNHEVGRWKLASRMLDYARPVESLHDHRH